MSSFIKIVLLAAVVVGTPLTAEAGWLFKKTCADEGCPGLKKQCCPEEEIKKVKETCWEVECKDICIPAVRFPWQSCCERKCGKVRTVSVLKAKSHEVEKCGTKWNIEHVCEETCVPCVPACGTDGCHMTAPIVITQPHKAQQMPLPMTERIGPPLK